MTFSWDRSDVPAQSCLSLSKEEPAAQDKQVQHSSPQEKAARPWTHQGQVPDTQEQEHNPLYGNCPHLDRPCSLKSPEPGFQQAARPPSPSFWPRCETLGTVVLRCGGGVVRGVHSFPQRHE